MANFFKTVHCSKVSQAAIDLAKNDIRFGRSPLYVVVERESGLPLACCGDLEELVSCWEPRYKGDPEVNFIEVVA